jgi:hypothetical protein
VSYTIFPVKKEEIAPPTLLGRLPFPHVWSDYEWFNDLPTNTFFALWLRNPNNSHSFPDLPPGHDLYVVTFHYEHVDCDWLMAQAQQIKQPIIILNDGSCYDFPWPPNVYFFPFYSWHIHLDQIMQWFPHRQNRDLKYKVSAVCNRITQSKLIVTTILLENFPQDEILVKLGTWLEEKNVHHRQLTGVKKLDEISDIFFSKYYGKEIAIDNFVDNTHNHQRINSLPWQPLYLESAVHLTNQSYHYSYMNDQFGNYIRPGPTIDEKTFKCLLAQCPFISVGQFDVYNQLSKLGLKFDYGAIDLSWDQDPGNLSRLSAIVDAIKSLAQWSISDIDAMTQESTKHNAELIWSGQFSRSCQQHNQLQAEKILKTFG